MKIELVNYEAGFNNGILTKFAVKMHEELTKLGHEVRVTNHPIGGMDITHHINYLPYVNMGGVNTLMVTHFLGVQKKLDALKKGLETAHGICMSEDMKKELVEAGMPEEKLSVILPAHDGKPRRHQVVAILTNVYPDGCKRAEMFSELAKTLDNNKWAFRIMGSGWEDILTDLVAKGLQCDYFHQFDADTHQKILESSDYCLYFGKDEGSMAILDAKNAGLKLITTNQGFHKDIGVDYPFDTQEELNKIFAKLSVNPVEGWTWKKYADEHIKLWEKLL